MHHHYSSRRTTVIQVLALIVVSVMLIVGAYTKLSAHPDAINLFSRLGLLSFMKAFGIIQIIILLCLWWRPLRILGTLLASAYFGAGVVMMLSLRESALVSTILLIATWIIHKCIHVGHSAHCDCRACRIGDVAEKKTYCQCGKRGCRCEEGKCLC